MFMFIMFRIRFSSMYIVSVLNVGVVMFGMGNIGLLFFSR